MLIALSVMRQYREKYEFYTSFKKFLEEYKINISFKQNKIYEFLDKISSCKNFNVFLNCYKEYLKVGNTDFSKIKVLDSEEVTELYNITASLGKFDLKNELLQLEGFILTVNDRLDKARIDKDKLCPMILKLSLLFALGVAILLI